MTVNLYARAYHSRKQRELQVLRQVQARHVTLVCQICGDHFGKDDTEVEGRAVLPKLLPSSIHPPSRTARGNTCNYDFRSGILHRLQTKFIKENDAGEIAKRVKQTEHIHTQQIRAN